MQLIRPACEYLAAHAHVNTRGETVSSRARPVVAVNSVVVAVTSSGVPVKSGEVS